MFAFLLVFGLLVYAVYRYYEYTARYPKGPLPLPFIGNLFQFDFKALHIFLGKVGKQFDGIYTIFTPIPYVQITDFDIIKEAYIENGDDFVDRPTTGVQQEVCCFATNAGIGNANGDNWREQRRTALSIMKDFGMGRNLMEVRVRSAIADYLNHLSNLEDKDEVDMRWPIQVMVANIINETLFGFRYMYDDCQPLMDYATSFSKVLDYIANSKFIQLGMAFPWLAKIPFVGKLFGSCCLASSIAQANIMYFFNKRFIIDNVRRALEGYDVNDDPTCFVQAYKQRMPGNEYLDLPNLNATCGDFFLAGQETTATTLRWAMIIMAEHQDVQMPFARACILEVQRFANVLPTNLQRVTVRDTEIRGHKIPKNTWINADIHYVMANDPLFEHPHEFLPERYLHEDGKTLRKDLVERTIPFSIGKRACAGEGLARVELFLALTSTLQRFKIAPCIGNNIDLEPHHGMIIQPKPQNVCLRKV